jgi:uncharacterized protein (TIRG00374 family)
LKTALGLCAGIALLWAVMLLQGISLHAVLERLRQAALGPLAFAAAGSLVLLGLQALRWWIIVRPLVPIRYALTYKAMAVGFFFNVLVPLRAGDWLRVEYVSRRTGAVRGKLLGTALVDAWIDKLGWVAAFPLICLFGSPQGWLLCALLATGSLMVGLALVVGWLLRVLPRAEATASGWRRWLNDLRDGLAMHRKGNLLFAALAIAPLSWLWETLLIAVASRAVGLSLSAAESFAVLSAFNLAMVIPSPGNAGTFESGGTVALLQFQVPQSSALALMFLYHLTQVLPSVAAGAWVLISERGSLIGKLSRRPATSPPR